MAKTSNLREFQETILSRLKEVANQTDVVSTSRLGVLVGEQRWLINLTQVKEALPVPLVQEVPLTMPWFLGVANIRGNLYNVADLAQYLGLGVTSRNVNTRILLLSTETTTQVALLIKQLIGLRNLNEMTRIEHTSKEAAADSAQKVAVLHPANIYQDVEGGEWFEVDLETIVKQNAFIQPTII